MLNQIGDRITVKLAAEIIGCSEAHVRRLLKEETIAGEFFSGVWAVSRESAEEFAKTEPATGRPRGS